MHACSCSNFNQLKLWNPETSDRYDAQKIATEPRIYQNNIFLPVLNEFN